LSDAQRKQNARAAIRDLEIPKVKNPRRRKRCEANDELFLKTYFPDVFYNPFTKYQKQIIADCGEALEYGTKKCKAAPRGDGKSSIIKYLALKYALARQIKFALIVAATGNKSKKILDSIQRRLASKVPSKLLEDYPLECHVARYVDPWPSRARNVTANGLKPINVEWGAESFILPSWADKEEIGPIFLSLGWTSDNLQGCNILDMRPDFVMLDDLDSRDSLAADDGVIAGKIEEVIDKTIAGLGGQSRGIGQFMLCTITSRESAAFKYSDPKQKPAFSGSRIPAIFKWPDAKTTLWQEYIEIRQWGKNTFDEAGNPVDVHGRKAHAFYVANRQAMDAGAELSNPYNYERTLLPDGSQKHLSSLQRCFDYIADNGMESFLTEHQNDPPEEEAVSENALKPATIIHRVNGFDRREVPPNCSLLTQGIDAKKAALHWVVRAWEIDWIKPGIGYLIAGHTIDYGVHEVRGTKYGSEDGVHEAIQRAVLERMEETKATEFTSPSGELFPVDLTCVDSRWQTDAVYSACLEVGTGIYPVMGCGKSNGCIRPVFAPIQKLTADRKPGDNWYLARERKHVWVVFLNADYWKNWEQDRWITSPGKPGSMGIFGQPSEHADRLSADQQALHSYSRHICNERETERMKNGVLRRMFESKGPNHWLDASVYADVAASIRGVRMPTATSAKIAERIKERVRIPLAELAKR